MQLVWKITISDGLQLIQLILQDHSLLHSVIHLLKLNQNNKFTSWSDQLSCVKQHSDYLRELLHCPAQEGDALLVSVDAGGNLSVVSPIICRVYAHRLSWRSRILIKGTKWNSLLTISIERRGSRRQRRKRTGHRMFVLQFVQIQRGRPGVIFDFSIFVIFWSYFWFSLVFS